MTVEEFIHDLLGEVCFGWKDDMTGKLVLVSLEGLKLEAGGS